MLGYAMACIAAGAKDRDDTLQDRIVWALHQDEVPRQACRRRARMPDPGVRAMSRTSTRVLQMTVILIFVSSMFFLAMAISKAEGCHSGPPAADTVPLDGDDEDFAIVLKETRHGPRNRISFRRRFHRA
jgi:hypothetical protein